MGNKNLAQIMDNIAAIRIAMLTTVNKAGDVHSRPMYTVRIDDKDRLWFYTKKGTLKEQEIGNHHKVNLAYSDIHSHTYLSISGTANEQDDETMKNELWDPALASWLPDEPSSSDISLLAVELKSVAFWDQDEMKMKQLL